MVELVVAKGNSPIRSVDDWFALAPPKRQAFHWVDGRSAKELAKAFFPQPGIPSLPTELSSLFESFSRYGELRSVVATPEQRIRFDDFKGEGRDADLACLVEYSGGKLAATVEAKADESFGPTVSQYRGRPLPEGSNVKRRIQLLSEAFFQHPDAAAIGKLRYQLLHAAAATLAYAGQRQCNAALFIIFKFNTPSCRDDNLRRNAADLGLFLESLSSPDTRGGIPGALAGPYRVPGNQHIPASIPLYIAKVSRRVRPPR